MSTRARLAIAGAVAVASLAGIVWLAVRATRSGGEHAAPLQLAREHAAAVPFDRFTRARVGLGDRCLRVLVADTEAERVQGLRDVRDVDGYDGMLFVYASDTDAGFTMAATPMSLDIGWYDARGRGVDRARMVPCPHRDEASCPEHRSARRYRYALETRAGHLGGGAMHACSGG